MNGQYNNCETGHLMVKKNGKKEFVERRKSHAQPQDVLFPELQPKPVRPLSFLEQNARWVMALILAFSDFFSMFYSFGVALWIVNLGFGIESPVRTLDIFLYALIAMAVYLWNGLYPGVGLSPVDEISKLSRSTNFAFLILTAIAYFDQTAFEYSRFDLLVAWVTALIFIQVHRWAVRIIARNLGIWGEPVVVVGNGPIGKQIFKFLKENARIGLKPYMILSGRSALDRTILNSINKLKISTVILVIPEMDKKLQRSFIYEQRFGYHRRKGESNIPRLILISSLSWVGSLGIVAHDFDGIMGLEVRQNLLRKSNQVLKRIIDLTLSVLFITIASPILLLIMAAIIIDSPGGIFYKQERIGRGGKTFDMWKFRTMVKDAEKILEEYLAANPEARREWNAKQKLKDDPRITRVGKLLRTLSLDEVPQFINVLKGEMSVVGPRPFFAKQRDIYGSFVNLYYRVRPGITGMWQVLGRNRLTFQERVRFDEYYIRNWSIWLDVYIMIRTIWVIITQDGAY